MQGILWGVVINRLNIKRIYSNGNPHHVTLQYGAYRGDWEQWIGKEFTATAVAHCHNEKIQAVKLALPSDIPCENVNPHITVSWVQGSSPVESNYMLLNPQEEEPVSYPVSCSIEFLNWD